MSTTTQPMPRMSVSGSTVNDRFKDSFNSWFWAGLAAATVLHFGVLAFWPTMEAADVSFTTEELVSIDIPPEVEIPPPPEQIARPATPVVSSAVIDDDITIAPTTFEDNPIEDLPPPPAPTANEDHGAFVAFTPDMVAPSLRNSDDVARALQRHYPPLLRDAGVGATVNVLFWIDENGRVFRHQVDGTSGYPAFDEAAGKVADIMQFNPAMNRDVSVAVVVSIPITFRVQ